MAVGQGVVFLTTAIVIATICWQCEGEIHRAKAAIGTAPRRLLNVHHRRTQERQGAAWKSPSTLAETARTLISSLTRCDGFQLWMCSIAASAVVGLSGIVPLAVIPLETGEALRNGAAANGTLKLLLSFAVGGLLGDVFLHLLPETWSHLSKHGCHHDAHVEVGVWVLAGLLLFLIIEKLVPDSSKLDQVDICQQQTADSEIAVMSRVKYCSDSQEGNVQNAGFEHRSCAGQCANGQYNATVNGLHLRHTNGCITTEYHGRVTTNGLHVVNGNHSLSNGHKNNTKSQASEVAAPSHIKTSGWLNLVANFIDNFTHGLAVAGSFSINHKTGLITVFAILLHEIPHEIGDFAILLRAGFDRWKAAKAQVLTATGAIVGAVAALCADSVESAGDSTAWILPFTSGGFIYIALVTVLADLVRDTDNPRESLKQFILLCAGVAVMAVITVFFD